MNFAPSKHPQASSVDRPNLLSAVRFPCTALTTREAEWLHHQLPISQQFPLSFKCGKLPLSSGSKCPSRQHQPCKQAAQQG